VLLLTSTGRRWGQRRTAPVLYLPDGDRLIVIGSNAGNEREPAWSLNLKANSEAEVEVGRKRTQVRARIADGDERTQLWTRFKALFGGFDHYRERTARDIAVFVLEPVAGSS